MKKFIWYTLAIALSVNMSITLHAQKSMGCELPNYILSEESRPIVFIYAMSPIDMSYSVGEVITPKGDKSAKEFNTEDEAVFNSLITALETRLVALGITPQGYLPVNAGEMGDPSKMEEVTQMIVDLGPYYTFTITIFDWAELSSGVKKNKGQCDLSLIKNPAYSIATTGSMDVSSIYTVYGGKDLEKALDYLASEIDDKGQAYFSEVELSEMDIASTISKNQAFVDIYSKESTIENSWPKDSDLSTSKTLIVCEDYSQKDKFMRYAETAIADNFPFEHNVVKLTALAGVDLSGYDYIIIPVSNVVERTKHLDSNGNIVSDGSSESFRTENFSVNRISYQMKRISDYTVFLGPDPEKLSRPGYSIQPYALRKFMKVFGKR